MLIKVVKEHNKKVRRPRIQEGRTDPQHKRRAQVVRGLVTHQRECTDRCPHQPCDLRQVLQPLLLSYLGLLMFKEGQTIPSP